jgi:hypothetical protein
MDNMIRTNCQENYVAFGGINEEQLKQLSHKDCIRFALFCAYQGCNIWRQEPYFVKGIELVELWLEDKATSEQCRDAARNTNVVINGLLDQQGNGVFISDSYLYPLISADYTIFTVAEQDGLFFRTAKNCFNAAYYVSCGSKKLIDAQIAYYNELRFMDDNFERIVLEGK